MLSSLPHSGPASLVHTLVGNLFDRSRRRLRQALLSFVILRYVKLAVDVVFFFSSGRMARSQKTQDHDNLGNSNLAKIVNIFFVSFKVVRVAGAKFRIIYFQLRSKFHVKTTWAFEDT